MERTRYTQSIKSLIATLLLTVTCTAQAEVPAELFKLNILPERLLPEYVPCTYEKIRYACFDSDKMVELNLLEVHARYWHDQWEDTTGLLATQTAFTLNLQKQIDIHLDMSRQDQDQILVLNNQIVDEVAAKEEWRLKAQNPPKWPLWLGGTLGVLGLGAFLGALIK